MEKIRRYDLDWLRVIVFGLLIFYHVGMFFVPWGWHLKNNELYRWMQFPMLFVNQWRLPLLFVISGMGTAFALSYRTGAQFIKERFVRLYIPLAAGMLLVVPPQVYLERLVDGQYTGGYLQWIAEGQLFAGVYPSGNFSWHHLWFLPYLLVFSLLLTPIFIRLRKNPNGRFLQSLRARLAKNPWFLFVWIIPLYLYEALMEPFFEVTHNLIWDWFNFTSLLTLFFYGFLCISVGDTFWSSVQRLWRKAAVVGVFCFVALLLRWFMIEDNIVVHFIEALIKVTNLWAWIVAILGMGNHYLRKPGRGLAYANRAVYPFYIIHQTVIITIGYFIYAKPWGLILKFSIMLLGTFGLTWILYEFVVRRLPIFWPLFGLKKDR